MNRKVLTATMHNQSNYIPGVGDVGRTLPSGTKTFDNLSMSVSAIGLFVKYNYKGVPMETLFPLAAVALLSLAPEAEHKEE